MTIPSLEQFVTALTNAEFIVAEGHALAWIPLPHFAELTDLLDADDGDDEEDEEDDYGDDDRDDDDESDADVGAMEEAVDGMQAELLATLRAAGMDTGKPDGADGDDTDAELDAEDEIEAGKRSQGLMPVYVRQQMTAEQRQACAVALRRLALDEQALLRVTLNALSAHISKGFHEFNQETFEQDCTVTSLSVGYRPADTQPVIAVSCDSCFEMEHGLCVVLDSETGAALTAGYAVDAYEITEDDNDLDWEDPSDEDQALDALLTNIVPTIPEFPTPSKDAIGSYSVHDMMGALSIITGLRVAHIECTVALGLSLGKGWAAVDQALDSWEKWAADEPAPVVLRSMVAQVRHHGDARGFSLAVDEVRSDKPIVADNIVAPTAGAYFFVQHLSQSLPHIMTAAEILLADQPSLAVRYLVMQNYGYIEGMTGTPDPATEVGRLAIDLLKVVDQLRKLPYFPQV